MVDKTLGGQVDLTTVGKVTTTFKAILAACNHSFDACKDHSHLWVTASAMDLEVVGSDGNVGTVGTARHRG